MMVVLTGICQVHGMAEGLRKALPGAVVKPYHVNARTEGGAILAEIEQADLTISQILPEHRIEAFAPDRLSALTRRFAVIPPVVFRGFHPDSTIVTYEGAHLESPIRDYHSSILIAAHLIGLPIERATRLFNTFVFNRLGHFDVSAQARVALVRSMAAHGLGEFVEARWGEWMAGGAFMHTPNHPKAHVLAALALEAARRAGLPAEPLSPDTPLEDVLAKQNAFAVHEDLARRLGVPPSPIFRAYQKPDEPETARYFSIERFAAASAAIFARTPPEALRAAAGVARAENVLESLVRRDGEERRATTS